MRTLGKPLLSLSILAAPLFAGALLLQVENPSANPEAVAKHALLVVQVAACRSPEKTTVTASAEGVMNGTRNSIPLKLMPLSKPGTFALARTWPEQGIWAVKLVATNPDYKDYATAVVVPLDKNSVQWAAVKQYFHIPADAEVDSVLNTEQAALARQ
ncbi:MAG: hypothetical protein JOY54_07070 [Acidobacteriaceae bacterium]|nr:hypothetical protein [Acidobacteriaceae bacterium]